MTRRSLTQPTLVLALWLAMVAGCTGTQETTTPVALVVAGNDADTEQAVVGLVASGLPPEPTADDPPLTWRPGFRRTVAGTIVDVAVARDDPVRLYVLHRDDRDRLTVFDASALNLDDPSSFPSSLQAAAGTIDLGERVADADIANLQFPDSLCSRGLTVSSDGRWAGVVHEADACGGVADVPAVLLIELAPDAGSQPRVIPDVPSTNDAPGTPVIAPRDGEPALVWSSRDGVVRARALSEPGGTPDTVVRIDDLPNVLSAGRGGQGLVVANEDALIGVALSDGAPTALWPAPSGEALTRVVDAHLLPGTPALALATRGLIVIADVDADPVAESVVTAAVASPSDAVVGPYGYAFVTAPATATASASLTAFDLLTYLATPSSSILPVIRPIRDGVESLDAVSDPVAVDWLFVPVVP